MILQPAVPPQRRRKYRLWNPTTYTVLLLIVAIVSVASWKIEESGWMENRLTQLMSSPVRFLEGARAWLVDVSDNIDTAIRAREELVALRDEVERLRRENQELRIASADVEHLRNLLNLSDQTDFHTLPALVINRDLAYSQALIINRGSDHGVAVNQPVISGEEGLVGRVERVFSMTARVMLVNDYSSAVGVRVEDKPLEALVRGNPRERALNMTDLFPTAGMEVQPDPGDRVFASGVGRVFPANLLVGYVEDVIEPKEEVYRVRPAVDGRRIYEVLVLLGIDRREETELLSPPEVSQTNDDQGMG